MYQTNAAANDEKSNHNLTPRTIHRLLSPLLFHLHKHSLYINHNPLIYPNRLAMVLPQQARLLSATMLRWS